jgi:hypothetical protein
MPKYSATAVADIVENEGLDYAIQHYIVSESITDPELSQLWEEARTVLNEIDKRLEDAKQERYDEDMPEDEEE